MFLPLDQHLLFQAWKGIPRSMSFPGFWIFHYNYYSLCNYQWRFDDTSSFKIKKKLYIKVIKKNDMCLDCNQINTNHDWCQNCDSKICQREFSENKRGFLTIRWETYNSLFGCYWFGKTERLGMVKTGNGKVRLFTLENEIYEWKR